MEEAYENWMTPIVVYLRSGELLEDKLDRLKALQHHL